jgi:hypothetical protein
MKTVTFFSTVSDLQRLTGLTCNELWNKGFDLDDWDWGFVSDTEWVGYYGVGHAYYEYWLLSRMSDYCAGFTHVEFEGRHYYMLYHS